MAIPAQSYLLLSAAVFCIGLFGVLTRRNALIFLMSVELMLNAANINFVAFSLQHGNLTGQVFALFGMAIAAAEVAVGIGIILVLYRNFSDQSDDDEVVTMAAFTYAPAIVLLPFVSFLVALFAGDRMPKGGALAGITATGGSLLLSIWVALTVGGFTGSSTSYNEFVYTWVAGVDSYSTRCRR